MRKATSEPDALALVLGGPGNPQLRGWVKFYHREGGTLVTAEIEGLPQGECGKGFFGFHIHEKGNCTEPGSHYDPGDCPHPAHAGDLPPLMAVEGSAYQAVQTGLAIEELIGRSVVIHAMPDDFRTQPAGGSGNRIGCGVILANYKMPL